MWPENTIVRCPSRRTRVLFLIITLLLSTLLFCIPSSIPQHQPQNMLFMICE
ncbi:hypothetical protein Hanom_Chr05g00463251 [Helianthus anomalus]